MAETPEDLIAEKFRLGYPIDQALVKAVREEFWHRKRLGRPIFTLRDGKVVPVPPEEIPDYPPPDDL
jgi:hypothetical protein